MLKMYKKKNKKKRKKKKKNLVKIYVFIIMTD